MGRFDGKGVIVTGGGRGIGQATAQRFASEGADVMVAGRTPEPLAESVALIEAEGGKAVAHAADVTAPTRSPGSWQPRWSAGAASTCSSTTRASTTRPRSSRCRRRPGAPSSTRT